MILFFNVCDLESIFPLSKASLLLLSYYTLLTSYMIYMRWNLAEVLTSLCRFCIGIRSSILKMSHSEAFLSLVSVCKKWDQYTKVILRICFAVFPRIIFLLYPYVCWQNCARFVKADPETCQKTFFRNSK